MKLLLLLTILSHFAQAGGITSELVYQWRWDEDVTSCESEKNTKPCQDLLKLRALVLENTEVKQALAEAEKGNLFTESSFNAYGGRGFSTTTIDQVYLILSREGPAKSHSFQRTAIRPVAHIYIGNLAELSSGKTDTARIASEIRSFVARKQKI